jgi:hypothetical protein
MTDAANYSWPVNGGNLPRIHIVTVAQLLRGELPKLPPIFAPHLKATRHRVAAGRLTIGE